MMIPTTVDSAFSATLDIDEITRQISEIQQVRDQVVNDTQNEMGIALNVVNLTASQFSEKTDLLTKFSGELDPQITQQITLLFVKERTVSTPVMFLDIHKIPYIDESELDIVIRNENGRLIEDGMWIDQSKDGYGLICFIPYRSGKKIYGFYKLGFCERISKDVRQFFAVGSCREQEGVPSIQLPSRDPVSLDNDISQNDRILAANNSPRFRKMADGWTFLGEAISDLNNLMRKTVDPNYIEKIMSLVNQMSYPPFDD